jgi:hypothetical protein
MLHSVDQYLLIEQEIPQPIPQVCREFPALNQEYDVLVL